MSGQTLPGSYDVDSRFIAAHHLPAVLIDLARLRHIDTHHLLWGCELFYEDIVTGRALISPQQFLRLIDNARRLLSAPDISFLFGQRLWPGHYGPGSLLLEQSDNMQQAVERLGEYRALLSPLLTPVIHLDDRYLHLYWRDSCGAGDLGTFLLEASMTAVVAFARRQQNERLPWRFQFAYPEPAYVEQYWVHLGDTLTFDRPSTVMSVPREYLLCSWPAAGSTGAMVARQSCSEQLRAWGWQVSFLDRLHEHLSQHIRHPLSLERVAAAFDTSPASLKRRLSKHGTSFQEQLDQTRRDLALYLYQIKGYSNGEVADSLGFSDTTNFRRSFKRWTGRVPSDLGGLLCG
ncbi:AraC family transcriptional regulator [Pseudomonas chlororaphis]|uniref:AraC family transcriptional regulator n=1 Tax=Pseudomonas chlororaphis TaxID=587753 RepID=UPI001B316AC6|nr:AraC family transcriptional regulator [Pseudomonas chlororaphis]MBP5059946.1 AraC family transcriptional regulator ligand-binding domain-containing protein [Pseudomonas chlororaphis]MBP5143661.1 AraC family transcriptional regulator ligand-binding domain-containing protein [Pseudomonas chlororaphis]QTT98240.1 AraC family transcriptional regulator ligand-binding domain-containing protein [Pseudomonas chlororaphis]